MAYEVTTNPLRGIEAKQGSGHYGVFDHGAHIWSWQPDGSAPVLWMSEKSWFADGQPIRRDRTEICVVDDRTALRGRAGTAAVSSGALCEGARCSERKSWLT